LRGVTDSNHLMTVSGDVVLSFWCVRQRGRVRVFPLGNPVYLVVYEVARVLEAVGFEKLKACPECKRLFVKVTKKRFCSTRCQSRAYMREYRKE